MDDPDELLHVYMARYEILQDAAIRAVHAPGDTDARLIMSEALNASMIGPGDLKTARVDAAQ